MGTHRNVLTGVVVSVDDAKDERYTDGWEKAAAVKAPAKKAALSKPSK